MNTPAQNFELPHIATGVHTKMMELTPHVARLMLARNKHPKQRRLIAGSVAGWKARFAKRDVPITHQGIAFGADGNLYDGQHRLTALSECDMHTRVKMQVTFNLPDESFMGIDQGRNRTVAHALGEAPEIVAVARAIATLNNGSSINLDAFTLEPYIEMIRPHFDTLVAACPRKARYWAGAVVRAAAITWMMADHRHDVILNAYKALNTQDFSLMTPVVLAAARAEHAGDVPTPHRAEGFAKLSRVFDPANGPSIKWQGAKNVDIYLSWVRDLCAINLPRRSRDAY